MQLLRKILATTRFEFCRSLTLQRLVTSLVMILFPPAMLLIILLGPATEYARFATCAMVLFVGLLSLLLWATPNVHGELEGRSWPYVASRSSGRYAILLGKYLNAVIWSIIISWVAVTLCVIETGYFLETGDLTKDWIAFSLLVFAAAPCYAAIFSLIGVIFSRKSMVFGAAYIVASEMILAWVPANINKFTGGFHLFIIAKSLFSDWFLPIPEENWNTIYGEPSVALSICWLVSITIGTLAISALIIRWREYVNADDPS